MPPHIGRSASDFAKLRRDKLRSITGQKAQKNPIFLGGASAGKNHVKKSANDGSTSHFGP